LNRRSPLLIGRIGLIGLASFPAACDYASKKPPLPSLESYGPLPGDSGRSRSSTAVVVDPNSDAPPSLEVDPEILKRREIMLANVIKLMQTAYNNPGGRNFEIATENLNTLFEQGTAASDYELTPASREFLLRKIYDLTRQDPQPAVKGLSSPKWTLRDARHIEDCMLYRAVALRVAGEGDDLTKVRRIFDWIVRQIQLVPAESLSGNGLRQAQVRPADVLMRGMATESGSWSERGWLFMALCRQVGVDVGLLTLSSRRPMGATGVDAARPAATWICAAVVDKKPYLFDPRIGMEIPGPGGSGVATVQEAIADPTILDRLELPGQSNYGIGAADLAGSPTRIGVIVDSSIGYLTPRMRLLQGQLRGEYRTTLFRDPVEQAAAFAEALGPRFGGVALWSLPIQVEERLFSDPNFVNATIASLTFFDGKLPLLYARTAQLRGDLDEATKKYVALRFAENATMKDPKETPIPPEIQRALDIYATYFLAQCQLDQGNLDRAEDLYRKMLKLVPDPGPGRYYFYMLRWGAQSNLGRICEAKGEAADAITFYTQRETTPQRHGNLLRARALVWNNPLIEPAAPLPPAPADPASSASAETPAPAPTPPDNSVARP